MTGTGFPAAINLRRWFATHQPPRPRLVVAAPARRHQPTTPAALPVNVEPERRIMIGTRRRQLPTPLTDRMGCEQLLAGLLVRHPYGEPLLGIDRPA